MIRLLSTLLLLWGLCAPALAATYYTCSAAQGTDAIGDDARSAATAQNPATPWLTSAKAQAQYSTATVGAQFLFCDGGTFPATVWSNTHSPNSTRASPHTISDYQSTGTIAPVAVTFSSTTPTVLTVNEALTASAWVGHRLQVTRGTGLGTYVVVTANTTSTVTVAAWPFETPDATSVMLLRQAKPIFTNAVATTMFGFGAASVAEQIGVTLSHIDIRGNGFASTATGAGTTQVINDTTLSLTTDELAGGTVNIAAGAGVSGTTYTIASNTATSITTSGTFVAATDATTVYNVAKTQRGIEAAKSTKYLTVDDVRISGVQVGVYCLSANQQTITDSAGDALSTGATITNSLFEKNKQIGVLIGCGKTLIENNRFDSNAISNLDHHLYIGGEAHPTVGRTISTIVGNGTTATATTSTAHGIPSNTADGNGIITVTLSNPAGYNASVGTLLTYVSPTQFSYPSTETGSYVGSAVYTTWVEQPEPQVVVRNNVFTNGHMNGAGLCNNSNFVSHGLHAGYLIEGNTFRESTVPPSNQCVGIALDSGAYNPPARHEGFVQTTIRGNHLTNMATSIGLDVAEDALIENNTIYSTYSSANGILFRHKNFSSGSTYSGTATGSQTSTTLQDTSKSFSGLSVNFAVVKITGGTGSGQVRMYVSNTSNTITIDPPWTTTPDGTSTYVVAALSAASYWHLQPDNVTIRNNTIYLTGTGANARGIAVFANIADANVGTNFRVVGNAIFFGASSAASSHCFWYDNMSVAQFAAVDYNLCYTAGSAKYATNTASATIMAGASLATFKANNPTLDQNSTASDPTITTPASTTTPPYKLVIPASGAAYNAGHPSLSSAFAIGGLKRNGTGSPSIGAFEPNASTVLPGVPFRIGMSP